jgi:hypothetical protein
MNWKNKNLWRAVGAVILFLVLSALIKAYTNPTRLFTTTSQSEVGGFAAIQPSTDFDEKSYRTTNSFAAPSEFSLSNELIVYDSAGATAAEVDQKIIKTGYLDLVVNSVDEITVKITALATGFSGYLQSSSVYEREDGTKYGDITIRVPVENFENSVIEVKKLAASVTSETSSGQDVTEQYTDLEARLRNAEAQETEYLEILKKAETVSDILSVQSYLGQVRGEIESLQGQIKYLENQTSYSTLSVSLSEEPTIKIPTKEFRPWSTIKEAGQALVAMFQNIAVGAIWLAILGGGLLLPIAIVILVVFWLVKKKNSKTRVRR